MLFKVARKVEFEYSIHRIKYTITTIFREGGRALNSLCFRLVFHITKKDLVIYKKIRQLRRKKRQRSG